MVTNLRIAIRYSVLCSLLVLLWLSLEFMVGLQDKYARFHPYISLLSFCIPLFCIYRAVRERAIEKSQLNFLQAFGTGLLVTVFAAILAIPVQLIFQNFVNPDFFQNMVDYAARRALYLGLDVSQARQQAQHFFNIGNYLLLSFVGTGFIGIICSLICAWRFSTPAKSS